MSTKGRTYVAIVGKDISDILGSTIFKIRLELEAEFDKGLKIVYYDNSSKDDSSDLAQKAKVHVMKYKKEQRTDTILRKAMSDAVAEGSDITIILDLNSRNDADDAVSLIRAATIQGNRFAGGWIKPRKGDGRIGCLALDRSSLDKLNGSNERLDDFIKGMLSSSDYRKQLYKELIEGPSKKKEAKRIETNPLLILRNIRRGHPLKFYGSLGLLSVLCAMVTGFVTVDYFYKNQTLFYPTAFGTVFLAMVGGFLLVTGIFFNAMCMVEESIKAMKKWERAKEDFRW